MYKIGIILYVFIGLVLAKTIPNSGKYNNFIVNNLTDNKSLQLRSILNNLLNIERSYSEDENSLEDENNLEEDVNDFEDENDPNHENDPEYEDNLEEDVNDPEDDNDPDHENDPEYEDNDSECDEASVMPPSSNFCGIDVSSTPRITDGLPTLLDQYPWLALIEYIYGKRIFDVGCGGSLISGLYVLTAAHCVSGAGRPWSVILGDYNRTHNGPDCVQLPTGEKLCSKREVRIRIAKTIPHPFYSEGQDTLSGQTWWHNDIALIQLQHKVSYTDSIRPICLPTSNLARKSFRKKLMLTVAGWGISKQVWNKYSWEFDGEMSDVKRHVQVPYVPLETCNFGWGHVTEYHVCAGGEVGKDSCNGDSGGPLMRNIDGKHELIGVVSYGENYPCGETAKPGIYANVYKYKRWIMDVIKHGDSE